MSFLKPEKFNLLLTIWKATKAGGIALGVSAGIAAYLKSRGVDADIQQIAEIVGQVFIGLAVAWKAVTNWLKNKDLGK